MKSQGEETVRLRTLPGLTLNPQSDSAGEGTTPNIKNMVTVDAGRGRSRRGVEEHDPKDRDSTDDLAVRVDPPPVGVGAAFVSTVRQSDNRQTGLWPYFPRTQTRYVEENTDDPYSDYLYVGATIGGSPRILVIQISTGTVTAITPTLQSGATLVVSIVRDLMGNGYALTNGPFSSSTAGTVHKFDMNGIIEESTCSTDNIWSMFINSANALIVMAGCRTTYSLDIGTSLPSSFGAGEQLFNDVGFDNNNGFGSAMPGGNWLNCETDGVDDGPHKIANAATSGETWHYDAGGFTTTKAGALSNAAGSIVVVIDADIFTAVRGITFIDGSLGTALYGGLLREDTDSEYIQVAVSSSGVVYVYDTQIQGATPSYTGSVRTYDFSGNHTGVLASGFVRDSGTDQYGEIVCMALSQDESELLLIEEDIALNYTDDYVLHRVNTTTGAVVTTTLTDTTSLGVNQNSFRDTAGRFDISGQYYRKIVRGL